MEPLKIWEIVKAVKGTLIQGSAETEVHDVVTDTRAIQPGMFFVPLKGERFDGHNFVKEALAKGAVGFVTEQELSIVSGEVCIIKVKDTLEALQDIAAYYRSKFPIPFIGITGSVGKTTTKDMIAKVLEQRYCIHKTKGNFNNEIGLPLTVFGLRNEHQIGITEMGMSGFGEISRLVYVAKPETAVITNIGLSHIEKLGSQDNILKAKMEIFENLSDNGVAVLNGDDSNLFRLKGTLGFKVLYYGINNLENDYRAVNIIHHDDNMTFDTTIDGKVYTITVPVMGEHNIYNSLAAIAVGLRYGMDIQEIAKGIAEFVPGNMRLNIFECKGIKVIEDCYNASPTSVEAALKVLKQLNSKRKIAILGDMLELGEWTESSHRDIGRFTQENNADYLFAVGKYAERIKEGALNAGMPSERVYSFKDNNEINQTLESFLQQGDAVLVKGSRGMKMENISGYIRSAYLGEVK